MIMLCVSLRTTQGKTKKKKKNNQAYVLYRDPVRRIVEKKPTFAGSAFQLRLPYLVGSEVLACSGTAELDDVKRREVAHVSAYGSACTFEVVAFHMRALVMGGM